MKKMQRKNIENILKTQGKHKVNKKNEENTKKHRENRKKTQKTEN